MTAELQSYIHQQIPITAAMGIRVIAANWDRVEMAAPLAANINHRETVFGGSAAAVATLAAWTLVLVRLRESQLTGRLVIAKNSMTYRAPITDDFTAIALAQDLGSWDRFVAGIHRKQKGRITATSELFLDGERMAEFEGQFVVLAAH